MCITVILLQEFHSSIKYSWLLRMDLPGLYIRYPKQANVFHINCKRMLTRPLRSISLNIQYSSKYSSKLELEMPAIQCHPTFCLWSNTIKIDSSNKKQWNQTVTQNQVFITNIKGLAPFRISMPASELEWILLSAINPPASSRKKIPDALQWLISFFIIII